jgi:hypothetical protein
MFLLVSLVQIKYHDLCSKHNLIMVNNNEKIKCRRIDHNCHDLQLKSIYIKLYNYIIEL